MEGIAEAKSTYSAWTARGAYFAWVPEYVITVSVARTLSQWCSWLTVWPEYRLADAMRDAGMGGGPRCHVGDNRRADLLLCWGGDRPRALIEVKRNVESWARIATDVERLQTLLSTADGPGSFELGMVAFSSTVPGNGHDCRALDRLNDRLARVAALARSITLPGWRCGFRSRTAEFDGHEYWAAGAVVLERLEAVPGN
jgi:hypothetical protein